MVAVLFFLLLELLKVVSLMHQDTYSMIYQSSIQWTVQVDTKISNQVCLKCMHTVSTYIKDLAQDENSNLEP